MSILFYQSSTVFPPIRLKFQHLASGEYLKGDGLIAQPGQERDLQSSDQEV
jgi:hypothetical protein